MDGRRFPDEMNLFMLVPDLLMIIYKSFFFFIILDKTLILWQLEISFIS